MPDLHGTQCNQPGAAPAAKLWDIGLEMGFWQSDARVCVCDCTCASLSCVELESRWSVCSQQNMAHNVAQVRPVIFKYCCYTFNLTPSPHRAHNKNNAKLGFTFRNGYSLWGSISLIADFVTQSPIDTSFKELFQHIVPALLTLVSSQVLFHYNSKPFYSQYLNNVEHWGDGEVTTFWIL